MDHFKDWILRDSLKGHERTTVHKNSLKRQERLNMNTDHPSQASEETFSTAQAFPDMDDCAAVPSQGPSQAEREMWDDFVPTETAFEIERGAEEILQDA